MKTLPSLAALAATLSAFNTDAVEQALEQSLQLIEDDAGQLLDQDADAAFANEAARNTITITHECHALDGVVGSVDAAASAREFGTALQAPQPFLAPALLANSGRIQQIFGLAVVRTLARDQSLLVLPDVGGTG